MSEYRVELAYRYKKAKGGVMLGMKLEAEDEYDAIEQGHCQAHHPVSTAGLSAMHCATP